jgi:hypothetical protein
MLAPRRHPGIRLIPAQFFFFNHQIRKGQRLNSDWMLNHIAQVALPNNDFDVLSIRSSFPYRIMPGSLYLCSVLGYLHSEIDWIINSLNSLAV